ncbi:hypothetical protein QTP86_019395 [Hemibagrus guttatus]|nr:hypothetical protein QTP86_019395 [Hemibagrus guttatus]
MTATQNALHRTLMLLPTGGGPWGRWAYVVSSSCAWPSPAGKDSATRCSPACPNPRPGSRCGLPSLEECKDLAEETYSQGEILKAVKYQLLSPEPEKALPIGIAFIKEQLSCPDWTVDSVYPVLDLLSYIRTDRLVLTKCSEERNELLILCGYIGALLAIGRQYSSIVPALYEYTRRMVYMVFKEGKVTPVFLSDRGKKQLSLLWSFSLRLQFGHLRKAPEWLLHQNQQSEPQAQPAVQKPTGATTTPEELCAAEPVTVRSCSAELVSVRPGEIERDQEKPCLTEPGLERPCSVDSGAVLELPVLAEAGTEVQSCRLQAPITTPVHGDGEDAEMEDEPTENCFSERSGAQIVEESFLKDLPKLSEQVARELDGELTLAELHKALQGMENGRAPEERVQLMDYQITETNPAEEGPFPQLDIAPDLDGSEGPLLECCSVREMNFGQLLKRREVDLPLQIEQLSVELEAWRACTHSLNKSGPVFFLEDGKSSISLNDALMWAKVNPFSPLGTGIRLNPF